MLKSEPNLGWESQINCFCIIWLEIIIKQKKWILMVDLIFAKEVKVN